ncbi:ricin B-related lectin [Lentinus brumalis]|uniref:Ricin B-related lectin n=1 Tax=Lentinus brumalis TaxID=2498619 RepID=A0A371DWE1_9APHY|nr:ricin B-related lectin [Polyporus brumalis]
MRAFSGTGIYHVVPAHVPNVCIAVIGGADPGRNGAPIVALDATGNLFDQMWLIEPAPEEAGMYYTMRNLSTGLYAGVYQGNVADGTFVVGYKSVYNDCVKWIIHDEETDGTGWKIQNKGCQTFMDLLQGGGNGTHIVGWTGETGQDSGASHQHWLFEKLSQTSDDVHAALSKSPSLRQDFQSYLEDGLYLVLSRETMIQIWRDCGVGNNPWRDSIFDCDDFATIYKAEVSKWGNRTFKAGGFAVLCGIMFGSNQEDSHAYNWTLNPSDLSRVLYFEPQEGSFSSDPGYQAYMGIF